MKNLAELIQSMLPIVIIAITTSSLTTVSVQGFKNFFNLEIKGNGARVVTILIATFWAYTLVIHFGGGVWDDFWMVLAMTMLGATGIYEILIQNKGG